MKTLKLIIVAVCVSVLALFLLGAECGVPVEVTDNLPPYYIMFKLDGVSKVFDKGFTDVESNAFANIVGVDETWFYATSDEIGEGDTWTNLMQIYLYGISEGVYSDLDSTIYYRDETTWHTTSTSTFTITKYEDVGGVIEGTFSGTVDGMVITEGVLKVKIIPDNTYDN
jgi:hypothetical protein